MELFRTSIGLLLIFIVVITESKEKKVISVRKCCRIGDFIDQRTYGCMPAAGADVNWLPKIALIKRGTVTDKLPPHMQILEDEKPQTCHSPIAYTGSQDYVLFSNGSLFVLDLDIFVEPENFCIDKDTALVCLNSTGEIIKKPKEGRLRKCCGKKSIYLKENKTCAEMPDIPLKAMNVLDLNLYDVAYKFPDCQESIYAIIGEFDNNSILNGTSIKYKISNDQILNSSQFCVEGTLQDGKQKVDVFTCSEHVSVVPEAPPMSEIETRLMIYSIGLFISTTFLAATLILGFLTPSNYHVMHWKCQTYYVACLLVGELLLAIAQLMRGGVGSAICYTIAIFMHFFFLAAFFWLNTMCFNIWWTFRDFRPTSMERRQENFRLHLYNVYAWGFPTIIAGIGLILDFTQPDNVNVIRPHFGQDYCWFSGEREIFVYFFAPIGILLFINLLLFAMTTRQLTCGLWKRDDVKSTTERAALGRVCMKLVIVMGITWIADVLSWAIGGPHHIWYITDIINALQGVFIFIVVASQPQVQVALRRLCCAKSRKAATNTTNGPQHSSSSHGLPSVGETTQNTTSSKIPNETAC